MNRPRVFRFCAAFALAMLLLGTTATFCVGAAEAGSATKLAESLSAASSPAPVMYVGRSKAASTLVTAIRPMKERRVATDALLLGAAIAAALAVSRRRLNQRLRDQLSIGGFFARRRGPPAFALAR